MIGAKVIGVFETVVILVVLGLVSLGAIWGAYGRGYEAGRAVGMQGGVASGVEECECDDGKQAAVVQVPVPAATEPTGQQTYQREVDWGGPDLWEAVNKRRQENGVNALVNKGELCTIASIRLNELLDLGKLDGHEGFGKLAEEREDLKWIFEKYTISEFLVAGASSPEHAVELWENTLGHSKLLRGGEYVWGCVYAQDSFGVAITAY